MQPLFNGDIARIYLSAILEKIPNCSMLIVGSGGQEFSNLTDDSFFNILKNQTNIQFHNRNHYAQQSGISFKIVEDFVNPNISYSQREILVNQKQDSRIEEIKNKIEFLRERTRDIKSSSIKDLLKGHRSESIFSEEIKKEKLLVYLIRNGFIDEMYHAFISYFYEGNITKNDMTFVLSVKNQEELDFSHPLVKVNEVVKKLGYVTVN